MEQEAAAALGRGLLKSALAAMRGAGRERSALILSRELGAMYCADGRHAEACALLTRQCGGSACEQLTGWPLLRYAQRRRPIMMTMSLRNGRPFRIVRSRSDRSARDAVSVSDSFKLIFLPRQAEDSQVTGAPPTLSHRVFLLYTILYGLC